MTNSKMQRNLKQFFILSIVIGMLSGCMFFDFLYDPPGKGAVAEEWYKQCQPIIESLESYKASNHTYPATLDNLLPAYSSVISEKELKEGKLQYLEYHRQDDGYKLKFTYYGPGVNYCVYHPGTKWKCGGYY